MKLFTKLIPLALLFLCFTFNADAQTCSYNIGEPNNSCGLSGSTWPVSSQANNIVGCLTAFDRDYYKITAGGKTYYVQVLGQPFNLFQGNYWLRMWVSGTILHLRVRPWFGSGASTKVKLYTSNCYTIGNVVYQPEGVNYLTYDLSIGLRTAGDQVEVAQAADIMQVADHDIIPTFAPQQKNGDAYIHAALAGEEFAAHQTFPNPASQELTITFDHPQEMTALTLFDMSGKAVQNTQLNQASKAVLRVADLPRGIYMLKIQSGEQVQTEKVVLR